MGADSDAAEALYPGDVPIDTDELASTVDRIIAMDDDEKQHAQEDQVHLALIRAYCPEWVVAEVNRLADAEFDRWYA